MQYIITLLAVAIFTILFLVLYKYVINPQVVVQPAAGTCPDRWNYNTSTKMCEPGYQTHCIPFDPTAPTLNTPAAKCNMARTCGTSWGYCP